MLAQEFGDFLLGCLDLVGQGRLAPAAAFQYVVPMNQVSLHIYERHHHGGLVFAFSVDLPWFAAYVHYMVGESDFLSESIGY